MKVLYIRACLPAAIVVLLVVSCGGGGKTGPDNPGDTTAKWGSAVWGESTWNE